jgi:hypothetical protein
MMLCLLDYFKLLTPGRLGEEQRQSSTQCGLVVFDHPEIVPALLHYLATQSSLGIKGISRYYPSPQVQLGQQPWGYTQFGFLAANPPFCLSIRPAP